MKYDIFISYSRKDTAVADKVCRALDRAGITYFIDRQGIGGGMEFPEVLAQAILDSTLFLLLASKNSYGSKFTNSEINFAFNEKPRNSILPYIIDDSEMPVGMRFVFSSINWRSLADHPIDTVLVDDLLKLLGRPVRAARTSRRASAPVADDALKADETLKKVEQARKLYLQRDYKGALPLFREAAGAGNAEAQYYVGLFYHFGYVVDKDTSEAFKWYEKAAGQRYVSARYFMGLLYYYGDGVERSTEKAKECYIDASEHGSGIASYAMGEIYERGYYAPHDYAQAFRYFLKSSEQGYPGGEYQVGRYYYNGYGVDKDSAKGREIIQRTAGKGVRDAQCYMGYICMNGDNDIPEAIRWFELAASKGDADARKQLDRLRGL